MLEYTKTAVKKVLDDFKRLDYLRNLITQVLYIAYLVYAVVVSAGVFWANVALLSLSACYFLFFLVMTTGRIGASKPKAYKIVKKIFVRCKQLIKLFTLGVMLYGIYATTTHVTPLSVILSALMIVGWILQVVFEVILRYFLSRANFVIEGMEADYENFVKPVKTVGNFFKKMTGKEVEPEKERSKTRLWLDKKVEEQKAQKEREKREEKEAKKQAKIDAKNTVFFIEEEPDDTPPLEEVFESLPPIKD